MENEKAMELDREIKYTYMILKIHILFAVIFFILSSYGIFIWLFTDTDINAWFGITIIIGILFNFKRTSIKNKELNILFKEMTKILDKQLKDLVERGKNLNKALRDKEEEKEDKR